VRRRFPLAWRDVQMRLELRNSERGVKSARGLHPKEFGDQEDVQGGELGGKKRGDAQYARQQKR
jgi:hypothetical protein